MAASLIEFNLLEMLDKLLLFVDLSDDHTTTDIDHCHTSNRNVYKIQQIDGKGYGMVASMDIAPFTLILIEKPLLMQPIQSRHQSLHRELVEQFTKLDKKQQSLVLSLSNCNQPKQAEEAQEFEQRLLGIYHTNCVGTGDSVHHQSALFATFARMNHSCLPNCCMYFEGEPLNCIVVKSLFAISKGEELSIAYIARLLHTFDERQSLLSRLYAFECDCKSLCAFGSKYDELIIEYRECIKRTDHLSSIQRAIEILNQHFRAYPSMLTHLYNLCVDICINRKLYKDAMEYIEKSIDVHLKCYSMYKRDRWKAIRRKIVLLKYKDSPNCHKYDALLQEFSFLFNA